MAIKTLHVHLPLSCSVTKFCDCRISNGLATKRGINAFPSMAAFISPVLCHTWLLYPNVSLQTCMGIYGCSAS